MRHVVWPVLRKGVHENQQQIKCNTGRIPLSFHNIFIFFFVFAFFILSISP